MTPAARFLQSFHDFPLMVRLGRAAPSWELSRWGTDTLRFRPPEPEGYTLRGSSCSLLYTGKRVSHRFTVLDDERFEYDLILKREPETNTVSLFIDGWEGFDFCRQPDTFGPEVLRGSYAVYRRGSIIQGNHNTGTGKICHIHRPKIVDAMGREVWGDIHFHRGIMAITIPEVWLGGAHYPVVVDPIIGTNTVGAYTTYPYISEYDYNYYQQREGANFNVAAHSFNRPFEMYYGLGLNAYTLGQTIKGNYRLWYYAHAQNYDDDEVYPVLYSNSTANKPMNILSSNEGLGSLLVIGTKPEGWRNSQFTIGTQLNSGTKIWLGLYCRWAVIRFDYGISCVQYALDPVSEDDEGEIELPFYNWLRHPDYVPLEKAYLEGIYNPAGSSRNVYPGARTDFRMSVYLENYANAYTRALTQGLTITDTGIKKQGIIKTIAQGMKITQVTGHIYSGIRTPAETAALADEMIKSHGIIKTLGQNIEMLEIINHDHTALRKMEQRAEIHEQVTLEKGIYRFIETVLRILDTNKRVQLLVRAITHGIASFVGIGNRRELKRGIADILHHRDTTGRIRGLFAVLQSYMALWDDAGYANQWGRSITDHAAMQTETGHGGYYHRELIDSPDMEAEPIHRADYTRLHQDLGNPMGDLKRMVRVFITLLSGSFVRDYLIGRFLKSKEAILIKSKINREITLDSKIH
jgi:hypothetical protein